ncbi:MAG: hypothetical protein DME59_03160 [Verrucomicrobia bacterium]|nr:MAG: hypothetical protein DME59_03160 [Verrucomicrobiota bacterium]
MCRDKLLVSKIVTTDFNPGRPPIPPCGRFQEDRHFSCFWAVAKSSWLKTRWDTGCKPMFQYQAIAYWAAVRKFRGECI